MQRQATSAEDELPRPRTSEECVHGWQRWWGHCPDCCRKSFPPPKMKRVTKNKFPRKAREED